MKRKSSKSGKLWTKQEVQKIRVCVRQHMSTSKIARVLGRSISAIRSKASQKRISLAK